MEEKRSKHPSGNLFILSEKKRFVWFAASPQNSVQPAGIIFVVQCHPLLVVESFLLVADRSHSPFSHNYSNHRMMHLLSHTYRPLVLTSDSEL